MRTRTPLTVLRSSLGLPPWRVLRPGERETMNEIDSRCKAIGLYRAFVALDHVREKARTCPTRNVNLAACWLRVTRDEALIESAEAAAIARLWVHT